MVKLLRHLKMMKDLFSLICQRLFGSVDLRPERKKYVRLKQVTKKAAHLINTRKWEKKREKEGWISKSTSTSFNSTTSVGKQTSNMGLLEMFKVKK